MLPNAVLAADLVEPIASTGRLVAAALIGIAVIVALILAAKLNAFIALTIGALLVSIIAGADLATAISSFTTGVGSTIAGAIRSANAHYANMLLAFYLATGQDAANIVEGSQGITFAEEREEGLYFSCTLPHLIVGTVGNGKHLPHVEHNLQQLGCREERETGDNARRLAGLMAATVLCGELSLLAAQTNPGELMAAHLRLERDAPGA